MDGGKLDELRRMGTPASADRERLARSESGARRAPAGGAISADGGASRTAGAPRCGARRGRAGRPHERARLASAVGARSVEHIPLPQVAAAPPDAAPLPRPPRRPGPRGEPEAGSPEPSGSPEANEPSDTTLADEAPAALACGCPRRARRSRCPTSRSRSDAGGPERLFEVVQAQGDDAPAARRIQPRCRAHAPRLPGARAGQASRSDT